MPALETIGRHQNAVLWAVSTSYSDSGRHKVSAAAAVTVRWESGTDEALDANGNTIAIDAKVVLNQSVAVGSIMWLGALADIASPPVDLMEVVVAKSTPSLKNRHTRYTVLLKRYSNTLPEIAS